MKTLVNQAVNQHQDFINSPVINAIPPKYTTIQKIILVAKALKEFHQDIAIPYKSCAKALIIGVLFVASVISFPLLLVRALDIEATERQQIVLDHEQYLKIKLKNDAPEEKGDQ